MSELAKNETVLHLDKDRRFKFNMRTYVLFEKQTGKSALRMDPSSITDTLALLWAGLKSAGEDITLEELTDTLDMERLSRSTPQVAKLIEANTPKASRASEGKAPLKTAPRP